VHPALDLNHFVVLKKAGRDGIVIHDPAVGVRSLPLSVVSRHFTGVALELMPVGEYQPAKAPPRVGIRSLLGRMVGLKRNLAQLFLLALAIEVFSVISRSSCSGWSTMPGDRRPRPAAHSGAGIRAAPAAQDLGSAMRGWR